MPNLNYDSIARILTKSEPQTWRILENGGMVVVSADGRRLTFTPAEVSEADLPRVYPDLPRVEPQSVKTVIVAPAVPPSVGVGLAPTVVEVPVHKSTTYKKPKATPK